ncbi:zinc-dependent alcohol dehydrogenase [Sinomonas terrae]|uniref:Alcohol dehydrogenase catalytic domain-containing protein n=1 Tax=Sinomonas terrae TaxID=2908838 RepID=A0ABS9U616_9MICC|nr:alcohol dehydrogenase catalytic domain-containing protein [Sinomonas terrae]MCH6472114.1 alcohol dehydrogenase catalytic domain-containing protein [Sinomonas terrae]
MKALVLTEPHHAEVQDVEPPVPAADEVLVDVTLAGICGTDIELFTGEMQYLHTGYAKYPLRIGHEWMGTVSAVGTDVDPSWLGRRVTGDTMVGCGKCRRCATGYQHVCEYRFELGVGGGRPGALAEKVSLPLRALHALPDEVSDAAGALVEPAANSFRAAAAANVQPGQRALVMGPGTLGLLCAMFLQARRVETHLLGRSEERLQFARSLGIENAWINETLPRRPWDAVIDASSAAQLPARAVELVEPGKRVIYLGIAAAPSLVDTRDLVLSDITAVGVLSGSPVIPQTIESFASGEVDPAPLIAATIPLDQLPDVLAGARPANAGPGPKIHVTTRQ